MDKQNRIVAGLTFISLVALIAAYFAPIWWVALTAPNYPKDAFPEGAKKNNRKKKEKKKERKK